MGEEPPPDARDLPRRARRPRAADPGRPDGDASSASTSAARRRRADVDFEDLLELAIRMFEEDEQALAAVRERYRAFTVDEYQDVNLLQQTLLERWLGERDEVCAVGDDYQSIYAFTGATPRVPARAARAVPARDGRAARGELPLDAGGAGAREPARAAARRRGEDARATRAAGPEPIVRGARLARGRGARSCVERVTRAARRTASRYEEMAVLVPPERALGRLRGGASHEARIPFQGAALLARDGARQLLKALRGSRRCQLPLARARCRGSRASRGWLEPVPDGSASASSCGRRTSRGSSSSPRSSTTARGRSRSSSQRLARALRTTAPQGGVHLLTLHRAKGLEFEAVFLPRARGEGAAVAGRQAPAGRDRRGAAAALRRDDARAAATSRSRGRASRAGSSPSSASKRAASADGAAEAPDDPRTSPLKHWRLERAKADGVPAYVVFHNSTLAEIAERQPKTLAELAPVPGVGPAKLERYGARGARGPRALRAGGRASLRVAANALARALALLQVERARVGERHEPALADQRLVHAAEPAAVRRVDGHAERRGLAVHRPAGRDDDVGERDQALRVHRAARGRCTDGRSRPRT